MADETPDRRRAAKLRDLGHRIDAARGIDAPPPRTGSDKYRASSVAWRMIFELVMGTMIGAAMGWGLDSLFGSKPLFLIVFTLLGLASGVRMMMHTAEEIQNKAVDETGTDTGR